MARQVLPIVGAVVGAYFGNPQLGYAIGSWVGNAVDPQVIKGPKLGEAGIQTSAEGVYRPIVYGTGPVKGNVIERGNRKIRIKRTSQGKGNGPVTEEERVTWTFAIRIAEGPIGGVLRIWQDEKLVYDITPGSTIPQESAEFGESFRLYLGDEDQLPDPDLEAYKGIGNVNAYRGTAYAVFPNMDLTNTGERIPDFRWEVAGVADIAPGSGYWSTTDRTTGANYGIVLSEDGQAATGYNADVPNDHPLGVRGIRTRYWGKFQFELEASRHGESALYGLLRTDRPLDNDGDLLPPGHRGGYLYGTSIKVGGTSATVTPPLAAGDRITVLWDSGKTWFKRNGTFVYRSIVEAPDGVFHITQPSDGYEYAPYTRFYTDGSGATEDELPLVRLYLSQGELIYPEPGFAAWGTAYEPGSGVGQPVALSTIISDLHARVGHAAADYDVSELTEMVDGLVLAGDYTAGDAIRTLSSVYFFDAGEHDAGSGYRINYVKRGKPVAATLTIDDLVEAPEESKREDALERPRVLHMHFQNPLIGYAPAKASPKRNSPDVNVVGELSVSVPVTFADVDEAWQRADIMLKVAWTEVGGAQKLSVPMSWLKLVPTDVIGLVLRDQVRRLLIKKGSYAEGVNALELMADRQSAYTSNLTGIPLPPPTPPVPSIVGPTVSAMLDIPALNDTNDRPLYYLAATGQTEAWYVALVQRQVPPDVAWADAASFTTATRTVMGVLMAPITAASEHYTDTTNTVQVQLYLDEEIESLTEQQFLSEGGALAIEKPDGGWEVMQYRDAVDEGSRQFTLSTLLRGRLNSGPSDHAEGALVVFLDYVKSVDAVTAWIGADLTHRAVSYSRSPEEATPYTDTYTMQSQREWPVAHLFGSIDGDSLALSCVPRHRFGTEDNPVRSANWAGYRWTATDGTNTATADTLTNSHAFDVTGWATPITATVAQLNRFTGAGPTVSEDFE